jgi:hypothetical protein
MKEFGDGEPLVRWVVFIIHRHGLPVAPVDRRATGAVGLRSRAAAAELLGRHRDKQVGQTTIWEL